MSTTRYRESQEAATKCGVRCPTCGLPCRRISPSHLTEHQCEAGHEWSVVAQPKEMVNHPSHYGGDVEHEVYKCLRAWGLEIDAFLWTVCKYIARAGKKGPKLEDLKKAQWYLNNRIEQLEKENAERKSS